MDGLAAGEILGRMDVFALESTAVAVDRLRTINGMIDEDPDLLLNSALQSSRAKYQSDLWRGCSELCLSPQARAKLGGLAAQKAKESRDPWWRPWGPMIESSCAYQYAKWCTQRSNQKVGRYVKLQARAWLRIAAGKHKEAYVSE
ncbi:hypothetical protein M5E87_21265 [Flavonifractor plautii]|nr:hypothetical protein M5E87_21265 [Flavonifractor plautii]